MQQKFIVCDPEKCLGCKICEFVCSASKEKSTDPLLSRIRVVNFEPMSSMAIACLPCEDPLCVRSCPREALRQDERTRLIIVDKDRCIGCRWCINACPFGAVVFDPTEKIVKVCDLCDGEPQCVEYCPFEALAFATVDDVTHKQRIDAFKKLMKELEV